jgi:lipopolysaccharide export system protein LptC
MKERLFAWLPLLPLLLLLAATYWLNKQVRPPVASNANLRHDPDYVINNFTATTLYDQGKPRFTITALLSPCFMAARPKGLATKTP